MEIMDVMLKRRSIRKYTDDSIPASQLKKIVQAGLLAPTSRNLKPCAFYIVKDRDMLKKLSKAKNMGAAMVADCNAAIIVTGDISKSDTWVEDSSIAMSYMMLMAEEQGIGNCWVQIHHRKDASGNDAEENVREILSIPENQRIVGILALGIPAEEKKPYSPDDLNWNKVYYV